MVYRIFVEKKHGLENEAKSLLSDVQSFLGITGLKAVRLFNRYDVSGISEDVFVLIRVHI